MMKNNISDIYKCEICGNIVEIIHPGDESLACCGDPMTKVPVNEGPEGNEKHIPIVTERHGKVEVIVGSVEHPMLPEHYIEWIELTTATGSCRNFLKPGEAPKATFSVPKGKYLITIYCNIHGLWDNISGANDAETKRKSIFN